MTNRVPVHANSESPSLAPSSLSSATSRTFPTDWRRRSADVGGLHLATMGRGQGQGWMGGDPLPLQTIYAELLSDMYTETLNSVNDHSSDYVPDALPEAVRSRLIHSLSRWYFEPHVLPEEEVLACTIILFETLFRIEGMSQVIPVEMRQIIAFLHHLRRIYRYENTYHNFEHALDVLQATHCYLKSAGMVPPPTILFTPGLLWKPLKNFDTGSLVSCLSLRELFVLYIAAIGHDVGHPGFTNMFMKNANTPLSLLFDHTSALEQMHYQLLKRVMRYHGLGVFLDDPLHGRHVRDILRNAVIFTDMGVHNDFMAQFKKLIDKGNGSISHKQTLVCQALLKNADISNPSRPFYVSTHWAKALMLEWKAQANLEEEYELKPSVMSSTDPIKEAESQIFFINHFVKPMLQLTVKAVPEMSCYLNHLKSNLRTWVKRKDELSKRPPPSILPLPPQVPQKQQKQQSDDVSPKSGTVGSPFQSSTCDLTTDHNSQFSLSPPASLLTFSFPNGTAATSPPTPPPRTQADSFMTAFPLTLPSYPPKKHASLNPGSISWNRTTSSSSASSSGSSSRCLSDHGTGTLNSPTVDANEFPGSRLLSQQVFSPISEASTSGNNDGHRCRSNSSVSDSSVCDQCGNFNSTLITVDSSPAFRIWCPSASFSNTTTPNSFGDEVAGSSSAADEEEEKQQHANGGGNMAHMAIRNASLLGSLRKTRRKDMNVGGPVGLKEFIERSTKAKPNDDARKAVRYSWCAGMAGLSGNTDILSATRHHHYGPASSGGHEAATTCYPTLLPTNGFSSASSSPEIPSSDTVTGSKKMDRQHSLTINVLDSAVTATTMTRLSPPPIKFQHLRVRSP